MNGQDDMRSTTRPGAIVNVKPRAFRDAARTFEYIEVKRSQFYLSFIEQVGYTAYRKEKIGQRGYCLGDFIVSE